MASSTSPLTLVFNDSATVWACERYVEILSSFLCNTNLNALFHIHCKASQSLLQLEAKVFDNKDCCVLFPLKYMPFFSFIVHFLVWGDQREVILLMLVSRVGESGASMHEYQHFSARGITCSWSVTNLYVWIHFSKCYHFICRKTTLHYYMPVTLEKAWIVSQWWILIPLFLVKAQHGAPFMNKLHFSFILRKDVLYLVVLDFHLVIYFFHKCRDGIVLFAVVKLLWMWISIEEINAIAMQLQHYMLWSHWFVMVVCSN